MMVSSSPARTLVRTFTSSISGSERKLTTLPVISPTWPATDSMEKPAAVAVSLDWKLI